MAYQMPADYDPYHDRKPIHFAHAIRADGAVSPLCATTPRALNLARSSWTNRPEAVTCSRCIKRLVAGAPRGSDG